MTTTHHVSDSMQSWRTSHEHASCTMSDLSPKWDEGTIAALLGLPLHEDTNEATPPGSVAVAISNTTRERKCGNTSRATLTFSSRAELVNVVAAYQGLAVPITHGYHYYTFSWTDDGDTLISADGCTRISDPGCVEAESEVSSPPLHLQLMALPTKELERRVNKFRTTTSSITSSIREDSKDSEVRKAKSKRRCRVHIHASLCTKLAQLYGNSRPIRHVLGMPVPVGSTDELLKYLRSCTLWPPPEKQRRGVAAGNYLTVRKKHPPEHDIIWNLCHDLINTVISDPIYNALAVTKSFRGSPHVDNHDKTHQHVIALGDFTGGMLCAEADEDGAETLAIDVCNRFGRIDGRSVHWVSGWTGERYSIVYYSTAKGDWTERMPQEVHTKWMTSS